jgi:hypothetical protein
MTPNRPALPAREPGAVDRRRPNPMACGIEQPRGRADLSALPALSQAGGFDQVDAKAALITASARPWTSGRRACPTAGRSARACRRARHGETLPALLSHLPQRRQFSRHRVTSDKGAGHLITLTWKSGLGHVM